MYGTYFFSHRFYIILVGLKYFRAFTVAFTEMFMKSTEKSFPLLLFAHFQVFKIIFSPDDFPTIFK